MRTALRAGFVITLVAVGALSSSMGSGVHAGELTFPLSGTVACDATTGSQVITWVAGSPPAVGAQVAPGVLSGAASGTVTWDDPILENGEETTTGQSVLSGTLVGAVQLSVVFNSIVTVVTSVSLVGGCPAPTTTTTTTIAATSTTIDPGVPTTSAGAVAPALPATGRSSFSAIIVAVALLAAGTAIVRLARRLA
jgi:hypothetical protein